MRCACCKYFNTQNSPLNSSTLCWWWWRVNKGQVVLMVEVKVDPRNVTSNSSFRVTFPHPTSLLPPHLEQSPSSHSVRGYESYPRYPRRFSCRFSYAHLMSPLIDSPKEIVKLEINWEWWIWRGFFPFSRTEQKSIESTELAVAWSKARDPVEEDETGVRHYFPLLKPSIDVLGVPYRSRKQRGWYQIRPPSSPEVSRNDVLPRRLCSGPDLPPELISMIVSALPSSLLATCASVCRHWADILQPMLFDHVVLRSRVEVSQLHVFHKSPLSKLSQYTTLVRAEQTLLDSPFLHRVKRPYNGILQVQLQGPLPPTSRTIRSIHSRIPRSLPRTYSSGICHLVLRSMHFQSFTHLVRLIRELPDLTSFEGDMLTWPSVQRSPVHPMWRRRSPCRLFRLKNCSQQWSAIWLGHSLLSADDHGVLVQCVDEMLEDVKDLELIHDLTCKHFRV